MMDASLEEEEEEADWHGKRVGWESSSKVSALGGVFPPCLFRSDLFGLPMAVAAADSVVDDGRMMILLWKGHRFRTTFVFWT